MKDEPDHFLWFILHPPSLIPLKVVTPLTTFGNPPPRNRLATNPAAVSRSVRTARALVEATCAATMTLGIWSRGWPGGIGSGSQTSRAAAARCPLCKAATSPALQSVLTGIQ